MTQDRRKDDKLPEGPLVFTDRNLTAAGLAHLEAERAAACLVHAGGDVWVGVGTKGALRGLLSEDTASQSQAVPSELASLQRYEPSNNPEGLFLMKFSAKGDFVKLSDVQSLFSHSAATGKVPEEVYQRVKEMREASYTISQHPEVAEVVFDSVLNAFDEFDAEVQAAAERAQMSVTRAYTAVRKAIKTGDLVRPDACSRCNVVPGPGLDGRAQIQAHHHDYSKPLEVEWLCAKCHRDVTPLPIVMGAPTLGEKNGQAKLTEADVISARRLRAKGLTYKAIAARFGVDKMTALRAIKGEQWGHVKDEDASPAAPLAGKAEPVAWVTFGTFDGKRKFEHGFIATNPRYCETHKEFKWEPLYAAPLAAAVPEDANLVDLARLFGSAAANGGQVTLSASVCAKLFDSMTQVAAVPAEEASDAVWNEAIEAAASVYMVGKVAAREIRKLKRSPAEPAPILASALTPEQQENAEFTEWWANNQACPEHNLITENAAHASWQERARRARLSKPTAQVTGEPASIDTPEFRELMVNFGYWVDEEEPENDECARDIIKFIDRHIAAQAPAGRDAILDEVADKIDAMNDSAGDRAAYENREMLCCEETRMWALTDCANGVRAMKSHAAEQASGGA